MKRIFLLITMLIACVSYAAAETAILERKSVTFLTYSPDHDRGETLRDEEADLRGINYNVTISLIEREDYIYLIVERNSSSTCVIYSKTIFSVIQRSEDVILYDHDENILVGYYRSGRYLHDQKVLRMDEYRRYTRVRDVPESLEYLLKK